MLLGTWMALSLPEVVLSSTGLKYLEEENRRNSRAAALGCLRRSKLLNRLEWLQLSRWY